MKKRILPALLALCMVMSLLPAVAFAAGDPEPVPQSYAAVKRAVKGTTEQTVNKTFKIKGEDVTADVAVTTKTTVDLGSDTGHTKECTTSDCTCYQLVVTTGDVTADTVEEGEDQTYSQEITYAYSFKALCDACKANLACVGCANKGCALEKDHDGACSNTTCYGDNATKNESESSKGYCGAAIGSHVEGCGMYSKCDVEGCTLDTDADGKHAGNHNNTTCLGTAESYNEDKQCGSLTHVAPVVGEDGTTPTGGCVNYVKCGVGGCDKSAGHVNSKDADEKKHNAGKNADGEDNEIKCLGYTITKKGVCGADEHIAGCPEYDCKCTDNDAHVQAAITYHNKPFPAFTGDPTKCTSSAGCPLCSQWNAYIAGTNAALRAEYSKWQLAYSKLSDTEKADTETNPAPFAPPYLENVCTCKVCDADPTMGAVTDGEGNEADPAESKDPTVPEVPVKAEDFTDIDAEDAGQEWLVKAVQTVLDNGWMQGVGGSKFEPGTEANTGMVLTVVARMYGEKGIEGAGYADLAKAWAEKNDLAEGIDLESDTIARKDIILLLWRLAGKSDSTQELSFTDVEGLEGDYLTALKWAVEKGIVMGNGDGTVAPDGILTRGQLAALVARYATNAK